MSERYSIVRFFFKQPEEIIKTGCTLQEVQAHCKDPETSSKSCLGAEGKARTKARGDWFDGYRKEGPPAKPGLLTQAAQILAEERKGRR